MIRELVTTEMINKQKSKSKHGSNMMYFFGQYKTRQKGNENREKKHECESRENTGTRKPASPTATALAANV